MEGVGRRLKKTKKIDFKGTNLSFIHDLQDHIEIPVDQTKLNVGDYEDPYQEPLQF